MENSKNCRRMGAVWIATSGFCGALLVLIRIIS